MRYRKKKLAWVISDRLNDCLIGGVSFFFFYSKRRIRSSLGADRNAFTIFQLSERGTANEFYSFAFYRFYRTEVAAFRQIERLFTKTVEFPRNATASYRSNSKPCLPNENKFPVNFNPVPNFQLLIFFRVSWNAAFRSCQCKSRTLKIASKRIEFRNYPQR